MSPSRLKCSAKKWPRPCKADAKFRITVTMPRGRNAPNNVARRVTILRCSECRSKLPHHAATVIATEVL